MDLTPAERARASRALNSLVAQLARPDDVERVRAAMPRFTAKLDDLVAGMRALRRDLPDSDPAVLLAMFHANVIDGMADVVLGAVLLAAVDRLADAPDPEPRS